MTGTSSNDHISVNDVKLIQFKNKLPAEVFSMTDIEVRKHVSISVWVCVGGLSVPSLTGAAGGGHTTLPHILLPIHCGGAGCGG